MKFKVGDKVAYFAGDSSTAAPEWVGRMAKVVNNPDLYYVTIEWLTGPTPGSQSIVSRQNIRRALLAVGDRVVYTGSSTPEFIGRSGVVETVHGHEVYVLFKGDAMPQYVSGANLSMNETPDDTPKPKVGVGFFSAVNPDDDQVDSMAFVRRQFHLLWKNIEGSMPDGRYKSIVQTKLEEAQMFASKAITHTN